MARPAILATFLMTVASWAVLLTRVVSDPTNHIGVEPLLAAVPFVILVPLAWLARTPRRTGLRVGLAVYGLLSILAIVAADRANVLVQYDRWAHRGMPERPCTGFARYLWACNP